MVHFFPLYSPRHRAQTISAGPPVVRYIQKVKNLFGANLLAFWPGNEALGTTAFDVSGNTGRDGTHVGVTLGQPGVDGNTSPFYDAVNDNTNIFSTGLQGAFNNSEGTIFAWFLPSLWNDGLVKDILTFQADGGNRLELLQAATAALTWLYRGSTISKSFTLGISQPVTFINMMLTWNITANRALYYLNGALVNTVAGINAFVGSLASNRCVIGSNLSTGTQRFGGNITMSFILNREATGPEAAACNVVP